MSGPDEQLSVALRSTSIGSPGLRLVLTSFGHVSLESGFYTGPFPDTEGTSSHDLHWNGTLQESINSVRWPQNRTLSASVTDHVHENEGKTNNYTQVFRRHVTAQLGVLC